jgi:hypothetical protein
LKTLSCPIIGPSPLICHITHWTTVLRPFGSAGKKRPVFSASQIRIAPDSNTGKPSSTIAGMRPLGLIARKSGCFWSWAERSRKCGV